MSELQIQNSRVCIRQCVKLGSIARSPVVSTNCQIKLPLHNFGCHTFASTYKVNKTNTQTHVMQASLMHIPSQTGSCAHFCRSNDTTHKTLRYFRLAFVSLHPLTVEAPPFRGWRGRDFCCLRHLPVWYHCLIERWESEMPQTTASQT